MFLSFSKTVSHSSIVMNSVWKASIRLWNKITRQCFRSALLKPPASMMRICFRIVDFPPSPAPRVHRQVLMLMIIMKSHADGIPKRMNLTSFSPFFLSNRSCFSIFSLLCFPGFGGLPQHRNLAIYGKHVFWAQTSGCTLSNGEHWRSTGYE